MFSATRHRIAALALGVCFILPVQAKNQPYGEIANMQARHIATVFPGRMTGTPAEMLSADYIRQQFADMGYQSDIRSFHSRYIYTSRNKTKNWHNVTGSTVIAAHEGKAAEQIIIMAHLDTFAPMSDADTDNNLGGLTLQGLDDNAAGLGVMLELAERMKNIPTKYGIRFIATSGEEEGKLGAENLLKRMSNEEKKNTLLVINLDNLIVGDKLYFNSGQSTPSSVRKLTRDRALAIARSPAATRIIRKERAVVTTAKCLIKRAFRCCTLRRRTGVWARKMDINSGRKRKRSRRGQAGIT